MKLKLSEHIQMISKVGKVQVKTLPVLFMSAAAAAAYLEITGGFNPA